MLPRPFIALCAALCTQTSSLIFDPVAAHKHAEQERLELYETNVVLIGGAAPDARLWIDNSSILPTPPKPTYPPPQLPPGYPCRFSVCVPGITHPGPPPAVVLPTYTAPNSPQGLSSEAVVPVGVMPESAPLAVPSIEPTPMTTTQSFTAAPPPVAEAPDAGNFSGATEVPGLTANASSADATANVSWMVPSIP
mmetsp:Transcript_23083/g.53029  ORF Transcript_23083/g.53029 Transcript_23083/m.53029 type:complete len:194 (+) Transcript_23083:106-687(+)